MPEDPKADPKQGGDDPIKQPASQAGTGSPPNPPPAVDADKIRAEAEAAARQAFNAALKEATGADSLDALKAQRKKAEDDRLAEEGKFKELAESAQADAERWKGRFEQAQIRSAITAAAADAKAVDAETVHTLLAGQGQVGEDGAVTIGGKPVADAVAQLLKDKPFLAAASGKQGSGSGADGGDGDRQSLDEARKKGDVQGMLAAKSKGGNA